LRAISAVPALCFVLFGIKENFRYSKHGFEITDVERPCLHPFKRGPYRAGASVVTLRVFLLRPQQINVPTAEALLYGVLLLQKKIRRTATIER
jgi:hypothetical protein